MCGGSILSLAGSERSKIFHPPLKYCPCCIRLLCRILKVNLNTKRVELEQCETIFVSDYIFSRNPHGYKRALKEEVYIFLLYTLKPDFRYSSLSFVTLSCGRTTHKLAINWQNFSQIGLQLKYAFRIRPLKFIKIQAHHCFSKVIF